QRQAGAISRAGEERAAKQAEERRVAGAARGREDLRAGEPRLSRSGQNGWEGDHQEPTMKTRSLTPWPAAAALALAGAAVLGAGLPPEQRAGGVTYVTGGVAADESAAFKQARADYPLTVQLVERAGAHNAYTANSRLKPMTRSTVVTWRKRQRRNASSRSVSSSPSWYRSQCVSGLR